MILGNGVAVHFQKTKKLEKDDTTGFCIFSKKTCLNYCESPLRLFTICTMVTFIKQAKYVPVRFFWNFRLSRTHQLAISLSNKEPFFLSAADIQCRRRRYPRCRWFSHGDPFIRCSESMPTILSVPDGRRQIGRWSHLLLAIQIIYAPSVNLSSATVCFIPWR